MPPYDVVFFLLKETGCEEGCVRERVDICFMSFADVSAVRDSFKNDLQVLL